MNAREARLFREIEDCHRSLRDPDTDDQARSRIERHLSEVSDEFELRVNGMWDAAEAHMRVGREAA